MMQLYLRAIHTIHKTSLVTAPTMVLSIAVILN
jgi:hypothetical protein